VNAIKRLNKLYSQVKIGGKVRIWDGEDFLTQPDFVALEAGHGEMIGPEGKEKFIPDSAVWLNSQDRNLYKRTTFYPGLVPDDTFNLWAGWGINAQKGDYSLFAQHLSKNICDGREDYTDWLWQWLAQLVQQPELKMGSAIALRGLKGTGKSAFADIVGRLCGQNYISISHGEQVLGRFNGAYERALLVCFEEAFWAGDKKGEGILKHLITCTKLRIERKGLESYSVPNFTRIIMVTNSDWIVPATWDERRFFVLDVKDHWRNNKDQFGAMFLQMNGGGYPALMYDLIHTQIDPGIDLRNPPMTDALRDQVRLSEPTHIQFFREWWDNQDPDWPGDAWARDLNNEMVLYCNRHKGYAPSWQKFMADLRKIGVKYTNDQLRRFDSKREYYLVFDVKSELWAK
jgi:hypothetical protein